MQARSATKKMAEQKVAAMKATKNEKKSLG